MNEFTEVMDPTIPHYSSSVEDEECSSSGGSFSHNNPHPRNDNGKRCKPAREVYALSCGMLLPKRHRRRRSLSDDQFNTLLASYCGSNAVSHEPSSAKSSSDTINSNKMGTNDGDRLYRRRHANRRPPTTFPSLLAPNEPFQKYVNKIYSRQYDTNGKNINADPQLIHQMSQSLSAHKSQQALTQSILHNHTTDSNRSVPSPLSSTATFVAHQQLDSSYGCDIVLSNQILSITDALEFSSKPHCLIEATSPHRVLHSNAALFASLLHSNRESSVPRTVSTTAADTSISNTIPSTAPSSFSSSWDPVQSQINLLFGLCFASNTASTSTSESTPRKGIVTLYPVYSTKSEFEQLITGNNRSSNGSSESIPPRYYLIEVSNVENATVNLSSTSLSASIQIVGNEKHKSSLDDLPKLVIA